MSTHTFARRPPMFAAIGIFFASALLLAGPPTSEAASKGTVATQTTLNPPVFSYRVCGPGTGLTGPSPICNSLTFSASVVAKGGEVVIDDGTVTFLYDGQRVCTAFDGDGVPISDGSVPVDNGVARCGWTGEYGGPQPYVGGALTAEYSGYSGAPGWRYLPSSDSFPG